MFQQSGIVHGTTATSTPRKITDSYACKVNQREELFLSPDYRAVVTLITTLYTIQPAQR